MPAEESIPQTIPVITFLLTGAGWPRLAFGLVLSIWGFLNLLRCRARNSILFHLAFTMLPAVIATVGIYVACSDFMAMAASSNPPKPAEFSAAATRGMSYGFCGLIAMIVPVALGLIALRKNHANA